MNTDTFYQIATWLVPLIIAIVFHEVAHGLVARRLGDPTAAQMGRLTLNPIRHVDPFGTIILPMLLALAHAPIFGWAKPVPVNYQRLRNPRRDMVLVALAGPGMNLLLAVIGTVIVGATIWASAGVASPAALFIAQNSINFVLINIFLAIFNLIPLPPFDGGHVVQGLLPPRAAVSFGKIGRYSLLVLIFLLLVLPMLSPSADVVRRVVSPIVNGIAGWLLRIPPQGALAAPSHPGSLGRFYLIAAGRARVGGASLARWSTVFVSPDEEPVEVTADAQGAEVLVLQFPRCGPQ